MITGLLGICITGDLFNLFVLLEVASLSGYALIAMGEKKAIYASFRYVIIGTIGASFYLLGVGYLYIATGSLNMMDLSQLLPKLYHSKTVLAGFAFILIGLSIKMALFPLHGWLPDAYTYAPSAVSAAIAPLMTKVMAYVIIRVMFTVFRAEFAVSMFAGDRCHDLDRDLGDILWCRHGAVPKSTLNACCLMSSSLKSDILSGGSAWRTPPLSKAPFFTL